MGKKNYSYTASYKLKVIRFAEHFGNRAAEREFGILEFSVPYWRKQKEAIRNTKSDSRAFRGPKAGKYPTLEDELLIYFEELRNDGIAVTHDMLQLRARELAKSHNISDNDFKASRGWLRRFFHYVEERHCARSATMTSTILRLQRARAVFLQTTRIERYAKFD